MPPKQRVTPGLGIAPTPVRPSARPTDSFVSGTGNATSGSLRELASSLSRFGEQGARFAAIRQQRQKETQTEAGRIAFLKELEEQNDTAKALTALKLRPQQSRFFRAGVEAAAGKVDALRARDFFFATQADGIEAATTLEEFDELASQALDEFQDNGDGSPSEAFENGFFPTYIATMENARFEFARSIDGKLSAKRLADFELLNLSQMDRFLKGGGERGGLAAEITAQLDEMHDSENPLLYVGLQELVVQNLKKLAFADGDVTILDIAKDIFIGQTGPKGGRLSLFTAFRGGSDGFERTVDNIIDVEVRDRINNEARQKTADDLAFSAIEDELITVLMENGGERTASVSELINKADSLGFSQGNKLRNALTNRDSFNDNTVSRVFDGLERAVWENRATVADIMNSRGSLSQADTNKLLTTLRQFNESQLAGSAANDLIATSKSQGVFSRLRGRFAQPAGGELTSDQGTRRGAAEIQLMREITINAEMLRALPEIDLLEWMQSHSNIAFRAFADNFQLTLSEPGGALEVLPPPARPATSSQPELESAFGFRSDIEVAEWAEATNLTMDFGDAGPPAYLRFTQRWNSMRPDAPIGSGQAFLDAWAEYRNARDGKGQ